MDKREAFCLRAIALICVNLLAAAFDGNWLYAAMAADFGVLGYSLQQIKEIKKEAKIP